MHIQASRLHHICIPTAPRMPQVPCLYFLLGGGDTTRFCLSDTPSEVRGHTPGGIATSGDQSFSRELGLEYTRTDIVPLGMGVRREGLSGGLGLTTFILHLQAHGLVGRRAIHNSFQDPLDQGLLIAWENPKVFPRQIAGALTALEGELDEQGGSAAEENRSPGYLQLSPG